MFTLNKIPRLNQSHKFGLLLTVILALGFIYFQYQQFVLLPSIFACMSAILFMITICIPSCLRHFANAWYSLGPLLGKIVSPVFLSIIFFGIFTPVSLITRLFGRDELLLKRREVISYWIDREPIDLDSFKNQF